MHAKHTLKVGVNVREKETSTDTQPVLFALHANHVVDKFKLLTQDGYKVIHVSAYKANGEPTPTQRGLAQIAQGLPGCTPTQLDLARKKRSDVGSHLYRVQPKKQAYMPDRHFVGGLIGSGIPLAELEKAFKYNSSG